MVNIGTYSDLHRALLQVLMNHGTLEETVLLKIFNQICQKFNLSDPATSENLDKAIDLINTKILNYDQKITKLQYGLNLINFYIFYSTATTSISKMQNIFNETELEFFKLILHKIIDSEDLSISPIVALNSQINLGGKVNQSRAGKLLQNWISAGYFLKHEDNLIYLGPKSLMEFKEILQNMELPYLRTCLLCEDVAPWGIACTSCKTATYHKHCIQKFLQRSDKCVTCKEKFEIKET